MQQHKMDRPTDGSESAVAGVIEAEAARSTYETQPHYMQALETIHRLTLERDRLVATLQGMIAMARIEERHGSKAWGGAADVGDAALKAGGTP